MKRYDQVMVLRNNKVLMVNGSPRIYTVENVSALGVKLFDVATVRFDHFGQVVYGANANRNWKWSDELLHACSLMNRESYIVEEIEQNAAETIISV